MSKGKTFVLRLRVWLEKRLDSAELRLPIQVLGRKVTVISQSRNPIREANWLVFHAGGFPTEGEAQRFGALLKTAVEAAGFFARLGVNVGEDTQTSLVNEELLKSEGRVGPNERVVQPVHGLTVYADDGLNRFPVVEGRIEVMAPPDPFLGAVQELVGRRALDLGHARNAVQAMNLALLNPQPLAQAALAFSAIEAFGQDEKWTASQASLIEEFAVQAVARGDHESIEVADAMRRSLFRIGVRQGVKRLLARLDLGHLQGDWDRLYDARSKLLHGKLRMTQSQMGEFAQDVISLCGLIVLGLLASDRVVPASIAATRFARRPSSADA
jgi:hypothetical protein